MRPIVLAVCVSLIVGQPLRADEPPAIADISTVFAALPDPASPIMFRYDLESLTGNLVLEFSRAQISLSITNVLQLPEYEQPGGVYLDEHTLLTEAANGIEIDEEIQSAFSLTFNFAW